MTDRLSGDYWYVGYIPSRRDRLKSWMWSMAPRWYVRYRMRGWTEIGYTEDDGGLG